MVDRSEVEVLRGMELTDTNRSRAWPKQIGLKDSINAIGKKLKSSQRRRVTNVGSREKSLYSFEGVKAHRKVNISGDNNGEATPVPIPNTEVKLSSAYDTWLVTARENRSPPDLYHGSE